MKKTRFLALFLCLTFALGFLPPQARAVDEIIRMISTFSDAPCEVFKGHTVQVDLELNLTTKKATMDYRRLGELEPKDEKDYEQHGYEDRDWVQELKAKTSGHVTYDIEVVNAP